jgi:hypothetical protein
MLNTTLNEKEAIATLQPEGALSVEDFDQAVKIIDPFLEQGGKLKGLIIYTKSFPGWDSFASLARHLKFVKNHHRKITHLAFVTDSVIGDIVEKIGSYFVAADVKTFTYKQLAEAKKWILDN